jgi:hypothetical protein
MTDMTGIPVRTTRVSADGTTFEILTCEHVYHASTLTTFQVDATATAVVHLVTPGQTVITATIASGAATPTDSPHNFGKKLSIPANSATGTYTLVVRHAGEAGGFKNDL